MLTCRLPRHMIWLVAFLALTGLYRLGLALYLEHLGV